MSRKSKIIQDAIKQVKAKKTKDIVTSNHDGRAIMLGQGKTSIIGVSHQTSTGFKTFGDG